MRYAIQFVIYTLGLLPHFLRGDRVRSWVQALLKPLQEFNDDFAIYVNDTFYLVSFTGQVVYMEHILNDLYDQPLRRIYIQNGSLLGLPTYIYNVPEQRQPYIYNVPETNPNQVYLRNVSEYQTSNDFIVFVPSSILTPALEIQIKGIVNRYKIAGKRYSIQSF